MNKVLVLGSSIALGVYVPAVWFCNNIKRQGIQCKMIYLESLYTKEKQELIQKNKLKFHKNFKVAKIAHVIDNKVESSVDTSLKEEFILECIKNEYDIVVCFSGFWISIMEELVQRNYIYKDRIKCVHMDAVKSNSWKNVNVPYLDNIWLFNFDNNKIMYKLSSFVPKSNESRNGRIVVHGGGWGMGNYSSMIQQINNRGYKADIICYYEDEYDEEDTVNRYFLLDPNWRPVVGESHFPPLLVYKHNQWCRINDNPEVSDVLLIIQNAIAVMSKPGGGTLADSMMTCTPIIFLEELAEYEKKNAQMWTLNGYGMFFDDWIQSNDLSEELLCMTNNLLADMKDVKVLGDEFTK